MDEHDDLGVTTEIFSCVDECDGQRMCVWSLRGNLGLKVKRRTSDIEEG